MHITPLTHGARALLVTAVLTSASACHTACDKYANDLEAKNEQCGLGVGIVESMSCAGNAGTLADCLDGCLAKLDCACVKMPMSAACRAVEQPYDDCAGACTAASCATTCKSALMQGGVPCDYMSTGASDYNAVLNCQSCDSSCNGVDSYNLPATNDCLTCLHASCAEAYLQCTSN